MTVPDLILVGFAASMAHPTHTLMLDWNAEPHTAEVPRTYGILLDSEPDSQEFINRRRIEILAVLRSGGTVVAFLGPRGRSIAASAFGTWLRGQANFSFISADGIWDIRSLEGSLQDYFQKQVAHAALHSIPSEARPLAEAMNPGGDSPGPVSFSSDVERGRLVFAPVRSTEGADAAAVDFVASLPLRAEYPEYLDALDVGEGDLHGRRAHLVQELNALEAEIEAARKVKRILYEAGTDLELVVVRYFEDELHVPAEHVPGNREDFWLLEPSSGERWCVGEVKGKERGNVARSHLDDLDAHRDEAGLDESFAALLVANTFHRAQSLGERDQPVHTDICARAHRDALWIVRTLDLVRLRTRERTTPGAVDDFVKAIRNGGGWYEVTAGLQVITHPASPL